MTKESITTVQRKEVVKPVKKKKTKEEKAQTVGERLQHEFDLQKNPKTGEIPVGIKELELKAAQKVSVFRGEGSLEKGASDFNIEARGPGNLGGRTRSIRFDVRNANIMLAGGVSSGVFRSTNGGTSWTKVSANDQIHNVTAIAQDTRIGHQDTWYYGTGELEASTSEGTAAYKGFGIWKSTDNGITWTALTATQTGTLEAGDSPFDFVHRIVVDPTNGNVYAAATDVIQRSTNGGTSWEQVLGVFNFDVYSDVAITSTGRLYAAFDGATDSDGVWTSTTGATGSWTKIAGTGSTTTPAGWNTKDNYGRIVIAIAPSAENLLYVLYDNKTVSDCNGTPAPEADFYKWNQTTTSWTNLSANVPDEPGCDKGNDPFAHQGGYDLTVVVNPGDANLVFIGGTNVYRSTNGFSSTAGTTRIGGYLDATSPAQYNIGGVVHHSDIHEIVFAPGNNDIVYTGTDGGIHKADITVTPVEWTSLNTGYITYQYYYVDISPENGSNLVVGGAQDNGTTSINTGTTAKKIGSGDGVAVGCISGANTENQNVLLGFQNGGITRSVFAGGVETGYFELQPTGSQSIFVTYFHLDQDNTNHLFYAAKGDLYRTRIASTIGAKTVTGNSATGWEKLTGVGTATTGNIQTMSTSRNG
ncbi:MAG: WD40/YVTN/BNR-like repeat-containing protein, partial [Chitinophagales bacterium]